MCHDEFEQVWTKSSVEEYNIPCIDRSKMRDQGRHCNCYESKTLTLNVLRRRKLFDFSGPVRIVLHT